MSFWLGAALAVLLGFVSAVLLYARGVCKATDEPFWATARDVTKQILSGDFFG